MKLWKHALQWKRCLPFLFPFLMTFLLSQIGHFLAILKQKKTIPLKPFSIESSNIPTEYTFQQILSTIFDHIVPKTVLKQAKSYWDNDW